jgi:hypothetical protein
MFTKNHLRNSEDNSQVKAEEIVKKLRENSQKRTKKLGENLSRDLGKYTNNSKINSREKSEKIPRDT